MSETELKAEYDYRYQERLGVLCGSDEPTPEQIELAHAEARQAVSVLREDQLPLKPQ